jgi:phage terminase small subunit
VARLTEKQALFVAEYLVDLNATEAAKRAGYSDKTAYSIGFENLRKPEIQEAIRVAMDERSKRTEITQDRVLQELAAIGFSRTTDFAQIRGGAVRLTETDELTDEQKRAVAGIKEGKYGIELKLHDKIHALQLIGQHLGMFGGKTNEPEPPPDDGFVDALRGEAAEVWQDE